ncbi:unnamed protein product [Cochlearia groenlandica]
MLFTTSPTSCLLLLFFLSYFHYLSCTPSHREQLLCDVLFRCGNITAGYPFWGASRIEPCGHQSLLLHCNNVTNTTYLISSGQMYIVHHIDNLTNTLRLARQDYSSNESFCAATFAGTTLDPDLFELSPEYKTLFVYYLCGPGTRYPSSFLCSKIGEASLHLTDENRDNCGKVFNVTVPERYFPEEGALDLTRLGTVLREGFNVSLKIDERPCLKCKSGGGICVYDVDTPACCKTNISRESVPSCKRMNTSRSSVDKRHSHCSLGFKCGDQAYLNYPFWTSDREECGHPDFEVNCRGEFAEFNISSVKFRIRGMSYFDDIIRLARMDHSNNLCHQYHEGASIDQNVLSLNRTEVVSFFYNCNRPRVDLPSDEYIRQLECGDNANEQSYFVRTKLLSSYEFRKSCKRTIDVPVSPSALNGAEGNLSLDDIKKALDEEFEVTLSSDCSGCRRSGGACGYNQKAFVCFCEDKPRDFTCSTEKKSIGFACGFLGATIIAGVLLLLYIRRRKKRAAQYTSKGLPTSSTYSSNTTSMSPTSTTISNSHHSLVNSMSNLANPSDYDGVQVFSYEELEEATDNFSKELGDGGFGTVYYGVLKDGRPVAVKRLFERSIKRVEQFKNEIEILKSLKHPNLVILYGCTTRHSRELLLVYEYISNGTVADHLHGNQAVSRPICWPGRLKIAIETASALSFLHTSGIIHRDVKTTNILLDINYQVKVADFGLSRLFPTDQTHISTAPQGTPGYVDPEYYQCYRLNEKSDVYSFGVVLSELISSKEAVDITRHRHDINLANMAISRIQNDAVHELADLSLGFARDPAVKRMMMSVAELAFRCLQQERDVRPSMEEIVEVLRGIETAGGVGDSPDLVEIDVCGGDEVGLLNHGVPPPLSPATDKETTSSSNTTASSF